ncbi:PilT/PilU family type 4a pilus ATPase [Candidatus Fermentibacterales bacterium]|nr:PilT/PilU family type 4a pilus ATPase [Candidatus Fermentibacterales bacterium]
MQQEIRNILAKAVESGASDIHLKAGSPPVVRAAGALGAMGDHGPLSREDTFRVAFELMGEDQRDRFQRKGEVDFAISIEGLARFRVNVFRSMGTVQLAVRVVPLEIPRLDDLNLPSKLADVALLRSGLVLITGPTGSGKSTTMAAMTEIINTRRNAHIVTLEDPIEFLFSSKLSVVTQREIGQDTESISSALNSVFRQDPDVILIGEIRDTETLETALVAGETGHLVLGTLHTSGAAATISRIIDLFPSYQHNQVRTQLSGVLQAIVSLRLLPRVDRPGLIPATELLIATPLIRDLILEPGRERELPEAMERSASQYGMRTLDGELARLFQKGYISEQEALSTASNPGDLALRLSGLV